MKKITILLASVLVLSEVTTAQRFVYVDTEYILERLPDYKKAQEQLDQLAETWRKEIDDKYKEIDKLYRAYQAEQVLLTEDMKLQKQKEIEEKEKAARELQKQKFGYEGELFRKKQELIKPIQDKIYKEIQKMATEKAYDFVFDKSSGLSMLYATPKYDRSDDILKALGIVNIPSTTESSTKPATTPSAPAGRPQTSGEGAAPSSPATKTPPAGTGATPQKQPGGQPDSKTGGPR
jgi:outer membrane protein